MKNNIEIKTGQRIFLIHYSDGNKDLCNIDKLAAFGMANEFEKIEHFWNFKFVKLSALELKNLLSSYNKSIGA